MADNLLDSLRSLITPQVVTQTATALGETEGAISKGFSAAIPSVLGAMLSKTSDQGIMSQLFGFLSDSADDRNVVNNVSGLLNIGKTNPGLASQSTKLLGSLLGNRQSAFEGYLAEHAGIKRSSANAILGFVSSLLMLFLGNKIRKDGLSLSGLQNLLKGRASNIYSELPSGISSVLGLTGLNDPISIPTEIPRAPEEASSFSRWVVPLLLGIGVIGLLSWFLGRSNKPEVTAQVAPEIRAPKPVDVNIQWPDLGTYLKRSLPTKIELNIPDRGMENSLLNFIEDPAKSVDSTTWINFDRLLFESSSATLKPESQEQLRNIAEILRAYPNVNVKIGGYTDNAGNPASNMKLSQDRATNVSNELARLGVSSSRVEAEGYGEQHPVADNSTEAGRAQNRRIALRVTRK